MITAFPLDNTLYDAQALGAWAGTRTRGVYSADGCLDVTADGSMAVSVSPGIAWMKRDPFWGTVFLNSETVRLPVNPPELEETLHWGVTLRIDKQENTFDIYLKRGTATEMPMPVQDDPLFEELVIACVFVRRNQTSITAQDITDTRLDESRCGVMRDGVTGLPTQELFDAWWAWFSSLKMDAEVEAEAFKTWMQVYCTEAESEWNAWFDRIQETLSEDAATQLYGMMEGHADDKENPHKVSAEQVGALPADGVAADAAMLGGQLPSWWMPTGAVIPFASLNVPDGWLLCDGRAVSRNNYGELFEVIQTTYGAGDGVETFNLPNMVKRFALGCDDNCGQLGGAETHILTATQMPVHRHSKSITYGGANMDHGDGERFAAGGLGNVNGTLSRSTNDTGGGQAHNNMPPYLTLPYIIKH